MKKKRIGWKPGDILKIEIHKGEYSFARVLESPLIAFYDLKTSDEVKLSEIINLPVLFKVWVMHHAVKSGRWEIIGSLALSEDLATPETFFKKDAITGDLSLYIDGFEPVETPATLADCKNLERAAVWEPEHIEDRLRDYYSGKKNEWVESLKPC